METQWAYDVLSVRYEARTYDAFDVMLRALVSHDRVVQIGRDDTLIPTLLTPGAMHDYEAALVRELEGTAPLDAALPVMQLLAGLSTNDENHAAAAFTFDDVMDHARARECSDDTLSWRHPRSVLILPPADAARPLAQLRPPSVVAIPADDAASGRSDDVEDVIKLSDIAARSSSLHAGVKRSRSGSDSDTSPVAPGFVSGRAKLAQDVRKRHAGGDVDTGRMYGAPPQYAFNATGAVKRGGAGLQRRTFKAPGRAGEPGGGGGASSVGSGRGTAAPAAAGEDKPVRSRILEEYGDAVPEALRNCEPKLIEMIENEIMETGEPVTFADIAGLQLAKAVMVESVVWPMQRPDLFTGLTRQAKGVLLFGPPGTGKTLIAKAIAHECNATFFSISASSLTSKWIGESEKLVRTLFAVASVKQPSIVFIDEIDSLLTSRSDGEHESSRRVKTEFLVQLDGAATKAADFVLVVGATNRPQELDDAARRRFTKRVYVPLPDPDSRRALVFTLLRKARHDLTDANVEEVVRNTDGYSGADLTQVCKEAAMGPLRAGLMRGAGGIANVRADDIAPIRLQDFRNALDSTKRSVAPTELVAYQRWNAEFGSQPSRHALEQVAARSSAAAADSGGEVER